jgi:hypothetical protein
LISSTASISSSNKPVFFDDSSNAYLYASLVAG